MQGPLDAAANGKLFIISCIPAAQVGGEETPKKPPSITRRSSRILQWSSYISSQITLLGLGRRSDVLPISGAAVQLPHQRENGPPADPFRAARMPLRPQAQSRRGASTMKILLVLPAAEHLRVTDDRVPKRKMLRFSVLSLTTVAALTPRNHDVAICDENVQPLDFDARCDVVGITFMTALAPRAYEIADEFRRRGKIVVAGGFHATFRPEEAAGHFDAVVIGDAEGLWPRVLDDVAARPAGAILPRGRAAGPCGNPGSSPRTNGRHEPPLRDHLRGANRTGLPPRLQVLLDHGLRPRHASQPPVATRAGRAEIRPPQFHVRRRQHHRRSRLCQAALPRDGADEEALDQPVLAQNR